MLKGIDISSHQGTINWDLVKVDFAIIRCGYGDDIQRQDDVQFLNNVNGCIRNNIPYGIYLYSYATNLGGEASIQSEVNHVKRLLNNVNKKPFCVYIDMEDASTTKLGKTMLTNFALEFCKQITNAGYKAGVYANENWFKNYLQPSTIASFGHSIWCAKYSSNQPNITSNYDIWQYADNGRVAGINTNVDMNYMYNDIRNVNVAPIINIPKETKIKYQSHGLNTKWYPNVTIGDGDYAGVFGRDLDALYIDNLEYRIKTKDKWLPAVKGRSDYAGIYGKPAYAIAIKGATYRVHIKGAGWLPWVTGYNINDYDNGYAGNNKIIDAVQIK